MEMRLLSLELKNLRERKREANERNTEATKLQYIMCSTLYLILTFLKAKGEKKIED